MLAIALGFDQAARGLMDRPPRPVGAPVPSRNNWIRLCAQGAVMTVGSLIAHQVGDDQGDGVVAATMLLTTLSVSHVSGALLCRDQRNTVFDRDTLPGIVQLRRYAVSLLAIIASSLVVVDELIKLVIRHRGDLSSSATPAHPLSVTPATT